jgi:hypothetical protein
MKPRSQRIALATLLPALLSPGCTEPSEREPEPIAPLTTKVRVEILALIYGDEGFRCEYEILEDAGSFKKGQRSRSGPLGKNLEEPILAYARDGKRFQCHFHFDEQGDICAVSLETVEGNGAAWPTVWDRFVRETRSWTQDVRAQEWGTGARGLRQSHEELETRGYLPSESGVELRTP